MPSERQLEMKKIAQYKNKSDYVLSIYLPLSRCTTFRDRDYQVVH